MSGNNSTPNNNWVRLNVGGKVFQTTKDTLSRYPESFLACLVNGRLPSDKDETGAFLIDRDPKQFRVILNYLRNGVLNMDSNEVAVKELLCEADFYGLHALVDEISKAVPEPMRIGTHRTEMIIVSRRSGSEYTDGTCKKKVHYIGYFMMSENREDYDVLKALRKKIEIMRDIIYTHGRYYITISNESPNVIWMDIELILRNFGFVQEFNDNLHGEIHDGHTEVPTKFIRTVRQ
ncbi:BTB/POZ domain-containing protein [Ditylenchus destructor]|nr:BTB/POZ domain-containing protein [Ditylenchus destructor]